MKSFFRRQIKYSKKLLKLRLESERLLVEAVLLKTNSKETVTLKIPGKRIFYAETNEIKEVTEIAIIRKQLAISSHDEPLATDFIYLGDLDFLRENLD